MVVDRAGGVGQQTEHGIGRADVFDSQQLPVGAQHATDLGEQLCRTRDAAEAQRTDHGVERLVGEGQRLEVEPAQLDGEGQGRRLGPGALQHALAGIDGDQAREVGWVVGECGPGAHAEFEHGAACPAQQRGAHPFEERPVRRVVISTREAVVNPRHAPGFGHSLTSRWIAARTRAQQEARRRWGSAGAVRP